MFQTLTGMLADRLAWFRSLTETTQAEINADRYLPVEDLHELLALHFAGGIEGFAR